MKTTYANMVGAICLDKATDGDGNPAPVTFSLNKVPNGRLAWQGQTVRRGYHSLKAAIEELYSYFRLEMQERGFEWCERGSQNPFTLGMDTMCDPWEHEDGFYRSEDNWEYCEYPAENYPRLASGWAEKQCYSYSYDNYSVCIVTSNGDPVY